MIILWAIIFKSFLFFPKFLMILWAQKASNEWVLFHEFWSHKFEKPKIRLDMAFSGDSNAAWNELSSRKLTYKYSTTASASRSATPSSRWRPRRLRVLTIPRRIPSLRLNLFIQIYLHCRLKPPITLHHPCPRLCLRRRLLQYWNRPSCQARFLRRSANQERSSQCAGAKLQREAFGYALHVQGAADCKGVWTGLERRNKVSGCYRKFSWEGKEGDGIYLARARYAPAIWRTPLALAWANELMLRATVPDHWAHAGSRAEVG